MRDTGPWTYGVVNLLHILGISTLFGAVLVLDLRMLGAWREVPLRGLATAASPLATLGFCVAAASGLGLISANGTDYLGNPFLLIKFPAIGLGLANAWLIRRSSAWEAALARPLTAPEQRRLAALGATSLAAWTTAIAAGRMIGYW